MNELLRKLLFLPPQRSTVAAEIDALHYVFISFTMGGAVLITLIGGYFLVRYRRRRGQEGRPNPGARSKPPLRLEAGALLGLFALFVGFWYVGFRQFVRLAVPPEGAMDVYVTAKQWMWKFAYPEGNATISALYVPAGRPVRLIMTSRDVIHSFFVPDFRIKQDVLPGRTTTVWFQATHPGTYQILCTEYCGTGHSTMRGEVVVLDPADFEQWLEGTPMRAPAEQPEFAAAAAAEPPGTTTLRRRGEYAAAEHGCLRCHTLDGTPHIGPTFAGLFGAVVPLAAGGEARVDEAYITASMMDPMAAIHRGFQPVMPSYLGRIQPAETAAIIELIKSLRGVAPAPAEPTDAAGSEGQGP